MPTKKPGQRRERIVISNGGTLNIERSIIKNVQFVLEKGSQTWVTSNIIDPPKKAKLFAKAHRRIVRGK
jgi:hypothetical protein